MKIYPAANNSYQVKTIRTSSVERQKIMENIYHSQHYNFYKNVQKKSLNDNIYCFSKLIDLYQKEGLNDTQINIIENGINTLLRKDCSSKTINLINVMYSTMIKCIRPEDILQGGIKPETYRHLIDKSIEMYKTYPLGKGIDYRHIMGRLVSLRDMSKAIQKKMHGIPFQYYALNWTENEQLLLVNTMSTILANYKKMNSDFVTMKLKSKPDRNKNSEKAAEDEMRYNYKRGVLKLLWMLFESAKQKFNAANHDEIVSRMEIAEFYFHKIPYNDEFMPKVSKVAIAFSKLRKQLDSLIKKNKNLI